MLQILVVANNEEVLQKMLGIIATEEDWHAEGANDDERAIELFHNHQHDLVILSGIDPKVETKLKAIVTRIYPQVNILLYAGGDDWFLKAQINTIMGMNDEDLPVMDNPFRP